MRWRPIAKQFHQTTRCGNKEAWARALKPLLPRARGGEGGNPRERRNPGQAGNPGGEGNATALISVLQRYIAWCVSTSGIEQVFSASERLMRTRGSASEKLEEKILRLVSARGKDIQDKHEILQRARAIWSQHTDRRPVRSHERKDKGLKRKRIATSEMTAVAHRREAVAAQAAASKATEPLPASADPESLPPSLQAELRFQVDKLQQRKVEALRDGALVPEEVDDNLREALAAEVAGARERAKKRAATARRLEQLSRHAACDWDALRGRLAWVAVPMDAAVTTALRERGLRTATLRTCSWSTIPPPQRSTSDSCLGARDYMCWDQPGLLQVTVAPSWSWTARCACGGFCGQPLPSRLKITSVGSRS